MKKTGILGGTFNPPHNGHIALAKKALTEFKLDSVIFIPTGLPPHKSQKDLAGKKDRLKMVRLAASKNRKFKVSGIEINRKGYSYAVDTFRKLRKMSGKSAKLYYIMGLDSINDILNWKKPIELFKLCSFIVATRPGTKFRTFKRLMKFPPISVNKGKISLIELNMKISSSDLREKLKKGKDVSKFVPKKVMAYIESRDLYANTKR
jgi:nicotinate-nucleotide adenylyltransferase